MKFSSFVRQARPAQPHAGAIFRHNPQKRVCYTPNDLNHYLALRVLISRSPDCKYKAYELHRFPARRPDSCVPSWSQ
jgi:hypothetical protein